MSQPGQKVLGAPVCAVMEANWDYCREWCVHISDLAFVIPWIFFEEELIPQVELSLCAAWVDGCSCRAADLHLQTSDFHPGAGLHVRCSQSCWVWTLMSLLQFMINTFVHSRGVSGAVMWLKAWALINEALWITKRLSKMNRKPVKTVVFSKIE